MRFNKVLDDIRTYEAGKPIELVVREFGIKEDDIVKLASNENPNGCSKMVLQAVKNSVNKMNLYPDDSMYVLKDRLSKRFGVDSSNIIIGAGSDQVIQMAIHAKANEKEGILRAGVTFAMYDIYSKQIAAKIFKTKSNTHNLDELYSIYQDKKDEIAIIFLCLPNNPLGESIETKDIYDFIKKIDNDTLVVVDGAYNEYAAYKSEKMGLDPKDLIENFDNVLYLGTFSKAYGLGGMRVGYGIAKDHILQALYKLRPPFNITTLSLVAASEALKDDDFLQSSLKLNFEEMARYEEFATQENFEYIESYTNFITYLFNDRYNSTKISNSLLKKGVIVRDLASYGINAIRVTIGTKKQNDIFFKTFKEVAL